jgi:hypothetical protein
MVNFIRWLFLQGGWLKLPWNNSWFALATFAAVLSGGLLISDFASGKGRIGFSIPNISLPAVSFFAKPGSLIVQVETPGAIVHLDGQPDMPAPATFPQVPVGHHNVTVSAPGYDPTTRGVEIKEAAPTSIDAGQLIRSTGNLVLTTIPAHASFTLKGTSGDNQQERTGRTPVSLSSLPVDDYQVTVDSSHDGSQKAQFHISSLQTTTETIDLVRANVAGDADPAVAKVLQGQAEASTLSDAQKKDYADLLNREIQEYVRVGAFPQANTTIASLKNLGQNTQTQEQHLSDMQTGYEQKVVDQIKDLITQKQLATARSKLKAVEDNVPSEMADRLNARFQGDLGPYTQQIDAAIKTASAGAPSAGYDQLQTLAQQYPDDVEIALAMARLLTQQAPDHARLSAQINTLKQFNPDNLSADEAGNLQAMAGKLKNELATLDRLQAAVEAEKPASPGNNASHIAALEHEIARDQASITAASGVNNTVDSLTSSFLHTHVRVVDVSAKQAEIERDRSRIQQIESAQLSLQSNTSAAQHDLDAFAAQVPW